MRYTIKFMKDGEEILQTPWGRSFETAQRHAQDHLPMHRSKSGATHVEVYDTNTGKLLFTYPS